MRAIRTTTISILALGLLAGSAVGVAAQDAEATAPSTFTMQNASEPEVTSDPGTGALIAVGPVESTPVVGDDETVYFGDNAGVIHAVDFRGRAKWTAQVGSPVRGAGTIIAENRVAFGTDDEALMVLKCDAKGLAQGGWPKIGGNLGQNGTA